ncbi:hypothetical protein ACHAWF_013888 [Thalassiosira exigua]
MLLWQGIGFQRGVEKKQKRGVSTLALYAVAKDAQMASLTTLEHMYTSYEEDPLSKHFLDHARTYNNGMAMSSLALEKGKRWQTRAHKLESILTASGQLIRRVGPLIPQGGTRPKCVQVHFYGPEDATYYRLQNFQNIPKRQKDTYEIMFKQLHGIIMNAGNKYVQSYIGVNNYVE